MPFRPCYRTLLLSGASLLAAASLASGAVVPANLARSDAGTRLTLLAPAARGGDDSVRAAQALLSEADPLGCALGAGTTTILLSLPRTETLNRFEFLNLTAAGHVTVAVSNVTLPAESPRWRMVSAAGRVFGTHDEVVACDLGHVEARQLKITFETQTGGRIDTFGIFGAGMTENTVAPRPQFIAFGDVGPRSASNGGSPGSKVRVVRVSSGSGSTESIVDGSLGTGHAFTPGDHRPFTIIDLGRRGTLGRANIAFHAPSVGRLDVYALNSREEADTFALPSDRPSIGSVRVEGRSGLSRVTLPLTGQNVRYLAIVFVSGSGTVDGKDSKDSNPGRDGNSRNGDNSNPRRSSNNGDRSRNGDRSGTGDQYGTSADGSSTSADGSSNGNGLAGRGPAGTGSQYGMSPDGESSLGGGDRSASIGGSGSGSNGPSGAGGQSSNGSGGFSGSGAGGGFVLSEVSLSGSGGFGNFVGFGGPGSAGGLGNPGGSGGNGGGNSGGNGDGGELAFNGDGGINGGAGGAGGSGGGASGGGGGGGAFNFASTGGTGNSGGSPLNLVPSLPPTINTDLITP